MSKKNFRVFFTVWVAAFCGLVALNIHVFFVTPLYEYADLALNALQIIEAKAGRELLGNYSRWSFHHPGPFFFYVYAGGEVLLYNTLKIAPAPLNAHLLSGLFLQTAFLALAVTCVASSLRDKDHLTGFAVIGAAYFAICAISFPGRLFFSIWPPDVLLMPFLAFLCGMAAFANGNAWALVPSAFSAGVLVHGHVAQPSFVLLLILCSAILIGFSAAHAGGARSFCRAYRFTPAALIASAPFLVTLFLEARKGDTSNLAAIAEYLRATRETKTFSDALGYVASFFALEPSPELLVGYPGARARDAFLRHWPVLLLWAGFFTAAFWLWRKRAYPRDGTNYGSVETLFLFASVVVFFSLFWAMNQTGPMYQFNAHFLYAPLCVLVSVPAALAWRSSKPLRRPLAYLAGAFATVSVLLGSWQVNPSALGTPTDVDVGHIHKKATELPKSAKLFLFGADQCWPAAAAFVLAGVRHGADVRVAPEMTYMFGRRHVVFPTTNIPVSGFDFLQVLPAESLLPTDTKSLYHCIKPAAFPEIRPGNFHIERFSSGTLAQLPSVGLSPGEEGQVWTNGPRVGIWFRPVHTLANVLLHMKVTPFIAPGGPEAQKISFFLNGESLCEKTVQSSEELTVTISQEQWNSADLSCLELRLPDCVSPRKLRMSLDFRQLGVSISSLWIEESSAGRESVESITTDSKTPFAL